MAYTVTFWGTRGSIPTPGPHTARYGGNTPCVAVESSGGELVILDAGTGIRALGLELVERQNGAVRAEILLSHAHWDHIQGLPHFKPFFAPGNAVRIWGSRQGTTSLEAILRQQMDPAVFPVPLDALSAQLTVQQVDPAGGEFTVGAFRVRAMRLRHPGTTLGFRLTPAAAGSGGGVGPSMAYVTDNELGSGGIGGGGTRRSRRRWRLRPRRASGGSCCSTMSPSTVTSTWTDCSRQRGAWRKRRASPAKCWRRRKG